jgi:hypothetical protein
LAGEAKALKAGRHDFSFQGAFLADESKDGALKISSRGELQSWLESLPPEQGRWVAVAIAARAALRVLPLVATDRPRGSNEEYKRIFENLTFAMFFASTLARVMAKYPARANELYLQAAAAAGTARAAADYDADADAAYATDAAARAAFAATTMPVSNAAAANAAEAADAAHTAAIYVSRDHIRSSVIDADDLWVAVSHDADFIASGGAAQALAREPLWAGRKPEWADKNSKLLHRALAREVGIWYPPSSDSQMRLDALPRKSDWEVWTDWYNRRLEGVSDPEEVELVFATVPDTEREAGPVAANRWIKERLEELQKNASPPPEIPRQGPGPHVEIDAETGAIVPAKLESLDAEGNNIARLNAHHPRIVQHARELIANLGQNEQPELFAAAKSYFDNVNRNLNQIDFERLWGEGVYLEEAEAAAARRIEDALREPLNDAALAALGALMEIHKPFILSTKAGLENLAAANAYDLRPKEEEDRRAATREFVRKSEDYPDVIAPRTVEIFKHFADQPEATSRPEREASFKAGMTHNTLAVVASTATVGAILTAVAHYTGTPFAAVIGLPFIEGIKKSKPFLQVSGLVEGAVNDLSEAEARKLAERLSKIPLERYSQFMLDNDALLRRLVGSGKRSRWLHEHLDWLKKMNEPTK